MHYNQKTRRYNIPITNSLFIEMNSLSDKIKHTSVLNHIHKPDFFYLTKKEDKEKFELLIKRADVQVYDQIDSQLKELIKSRNPKLRLSDEDCNLLILKYLNGGSREDYGVWVYYPWSGRMVHMLDREEFIELRTAANRHKITLEEKNILGTKKVGVIGLSVGQSVSLTLAMERSCGELRLADFDTLELNNLNRIRTGVHNLGLYKAYSVAREIAEIDPFFKVVCFIDGVTESNIHEFFNSDGKLDAVIDECDSVNVKIMCRIKAKEYHVPVLMEASDRGTLDIERFDLDPRRPIMHGWLEHLPIDFEVLNNLKTAQEKLPYILPISGLETLSSRMRASMIEIQNTITTWPQLATAVTLGGAITADTCRRIFLDQFTDSGRYFIDMESLVRDIRPKREYQPSEDDQLLDENGMSTIAGLAMQKLTPTNFEPDLKDVRHLVSAAILAPSKNNSQPWKWYFSNSCLFLFAENEDPAPFFDFKGVSTFIANGAAIENLELEANKRNIGVKVHLLPLTDYKKLVAVIQFTDIPEVLPKPRDKDGLANYIPYRFTNRNPGNKEEINKNKLDKLRKSVSSVKGAELIIKDNPEDIQKIASILGVCDRIKLLYEPSHFEFFSKLRWSNDECARSGDGVHIDSMGLSPAEIIMLKMIKKQDVIRFLSNLKGGQALEFSARHSISSSSAIGLITVPNFTPLNHVLAGKATQRMWLTATKSGIALQPLQTTITQFIHLENGNVNGMQNYMENELAEQYNEFKLLFNGNEKKSAAFLFRLSNAEQPTIRNYRKQLEKVLFLSNHT